MNTTEKFDTYLRNWDKICKWIKDNANFPHLEYFRGDFDPYYWYSLAVDATGKAFIFIGDHSSDSVPHTVYHDHKHCFDCHYASVFFWKDTTTDFLATGFLGREWDIKDTIPKDMITIVDNWHTSFKPRIEAMIRKYQNLNDFEA